MEGTAGAGAEGTEDAGAEEAADAGAEGIDRATGALGVGAERALGTDIEAGAEEAAGTPGTDVEAGAEDTPGAEGAAGTYVEGTPGAEGAAGTDIEAGAEEAAGAAGVYAEGTAGADGPAGAARTSSNWVGPPTWPAAGAEGAGGTEEPP